MNLDKRKLPIYFALLVVSVWMLCTIYEFW